MRPNSIQFFSLVFLLLFSACKAPIVPPSQTPSPTATSVLVTPQLLSPTPTSTPTPSSIILQPGKAWPDPMPNTKRWTRIGREHMTLYPFNWPEDYVYAKDGTLWVVGGFGIVRKAPDGTQIWYSRLDGLPVGLMSAIAISPTGEVWVGGAENTLLRFDGQGWIDEGARLPAPLDPRSHYICYSHNISGIDFGPDGSAWVINAGIELYHQVPVGWVNVPFPKEMLPAGGGGGCPIGLQVDSDTHIVILRSGCCESAPVSYTFDGQSWGTKQEDQDVIETWNPTPHGDGPSLWHYPYPDLSKSEPSQWPFDVSHLLPPHIRASFYQVRLALDSQGRVWLDASYTLVANNNQDVFDEVAYGMGEPSLSASQVLNFGQKVFYYQPDTQHRQLGNFLPPDLQDYFNERWHTVDQQGRVWFYQPERGETPASGLVSFGPDTPSVQRYGAMPAPLQGPTAGIVALSDGQIWLGGVGRIVEYASGVWNVIAGLGNQEAFTHLAEAPAGEVFAANGTSVYRIAGQQKDSVDFVHPGLPPVIPDAEVPGDPDCTYQRSYIKTGCFQFISLAAEPQTTVNYTARYLGFHPDGSLIYVNNHILARYQDGAWQPYAFDSMEIEAATVDHQGNIWLYIQDVGLLKLDPQALQP